MQQLTAWLCSHEIRSVWERWGVHLPNIEFEHAPHMCSLWDHEKAVVDAKICHLPDVRRLLCPGPCLASSLAPALGLLSVERKDGCCVIGQAYCEPQAQGTGHKQSLSSQG